MITLPQARTPKGMKGGSTDRAGGPGACPRKFF